MVKTPIAIALSRFAPRWCVAPLLLLIYSSMLISVALFLFPVDPFEMVYVDL